MHPFSCIQYHASYGIFKGFMKAWPLVFLSILELQHCCLSLCLSSVPPVCFSSVSPVSPVSLKCLSSVSSLSLQRLSCVSSVSKVSLHCLSSVSPVSPVSLKCLFIVSPLHCLSSVSLVSLQYLSSVFPVSVQSLSNVSVESSVLLLSVITQQNIPIHATFHTKPACYAATFRLKLATFSLELSVFFVCGTMNFLFSINIISCFHISESVTGKGAEQQQM